MNPIPSRTVKGWVMVNGTGWPFINTACLRRSDAIDAYHEAGIGLYSDDRRKYGVQVVRCTISTEARDVA